MAVLSSLLLTTAPAAAADVTVTLPPLAGLVAMLDGKAHVRCLLPAGADPHHFQLTPRKVEAVANSSLLIRAGVDDAGWPLPPDHDHTLKLWPETRHGWLDPAAVRSALPRIAAALQSLHPQRSDAIASALKQALTTADQIELQWQRVLMPLKNSGVVMQHPAWQPLLQRMGVPVLTVLESAQHGHEHGPHKLEHALATLNTHPGAWLLADHGHSNRALSWLARHSAVPTHQVTLDALGACNMPWRDLMQQNLATIAATTLP